MGQTINRQNLTRPITTRDLLLHTARFASAGILVLSTHVFAMDVQQSGTSNSATVEQESLVYAEKSTVDQMGESNDAVVFQRGSGDVNQMLVTQITQTGEFNSATTTQYALQGHIIIQQSGSQNQAQVEQQEISEASAEILQKGTRNFAEVRQLISTEESYRVLQASITQDGSDNQATVTQNTFEGGLTVTQTGADNILQVDQGEGLPSQYDRDGQILVEMTGDGNEANIVHGGVHAGGLAEIHYSGSGNILELVQRGETPVVRIDSVNSDGNRDTIVQRSGGWEEILIERTDTHYSQVNINQDGMNFDAFVQQISAHGAVAEFDQVDDFSGAQAEIIQTDVVDSLARIEQGGTGKALIIQNSVDNAEALIQMLSPDSPEVIIVQMGGTGNQGEINLDGWLLAHSLIDQQGSFNDAQITHMSRGADLDSFVGLTASITQIGDHNTAVIAQNF